MAATARAHFTVARPSGARVGLDQARAWGLPWVLTLTLSGLVLTPLLLLFGSSLRTESSMLSLDAYQKVFSTPNTYQLIWTTVWLACARVALGTFIGILLAWVVARTDTPWRGGIEALMWVKFFTPPLPIIIAWTLLAGKNGLFNQLLKQLPFVQGPVFDVYSYAGIIWVTSLQVAAFVFLLTVPTFRSMDASLEESARASGASRLQVLRSITVPVALPTILGAIFLAFMTALESFEPEVILGVPSRIYVLSTRIFVLTQEAPRDLPAATALSSTFLVMVGALFLMQARWLRGRSFTTVTGRGFSQRPSPLGAWKWVAFSLCCTYFLIAAVMPIAMLIVGSFMKAWGVWSAEPFTLAQWQMALSDPRLLGSIANTIVLGLLVGSLGTLVSALAAYVFVRTSFSGRRVLEFVTLAPRIAPGVVLAVAFVWVFVEQPIFRPIAGSLLIMGIVMVVSFLPLGSRIANGAMYQISRELEEAARACGSSWLSMMTRVLLPLLTPALMTAFVLLFLAAIRNLILVVYFYTPRTRVLSVLLWEAWSNQSGTQAAIPGLIMMLLSLCVLAGALLLRKRTGTLGI